jgi:hypothetical protein
MANYNRIVYVALLSVPFLVQLYAQSKDIQGGQVCHGHAHLCNRRYNEVAYVMTHNSTSYKPSLTQDQDRSVQQQLADGVRGFKIPIHYDYTNRFAYWVTFLTMARDRLLDQENKRIEALKSSQSSIQRGFEAKKASVETLRQQISDIDNQIRSLQS